MKLTNSIMVSAKCVSNLTVLAMKYIIGTHILLNDLDTVIAEFCRKCKAFNRVHYKIYLPYIHGSTVGSILDLNTVSTEPKFAHNFKVYVFEMVPFGI